MCVWEEGCRGSGVDHSRALELAWHARAARLTGCKGKEQLGTEVTRGEREDFIKRAKRVSKAAPDDQSSAAAATAAAAHV